MWVGMVEKELRLRFEMVFLTEVEVKLELGLLFFWMTERVSLRKMRVVALW